MLRATINDSDLCAPADCIGGGVTIGESFIDPVRHRMLRTVITESPSFLRVTVLERAVSDTQNVEVIRSLTDEQHQALICEMNTYPLDWGQLTVDRMGRLVSYRASGLSSLPIFAKRRIDGLEIDWDYARLLDCAEADMDWSALLAHVGGVAPYSARTMITGLMRSTANATLVMAPEGIIVERPAAIVQSGPQRLIASADPQKLLFDTVKAQIEIRPLEPRRTAVEISGGMDSALTSLAVSEVLGPGVMSLGAQFDGAMGQAQRRRRRRLIEHGGFYDLELPAERFTPFSPTSPRRRRFGVYPQDETYPEIFEAAFATLTQAGVDVLVSGFGGDELYPAYEGEGEDDLGLPDLASHPFLTDQGRLLAKAATVPYPQGALQETCWRAAAGRAQRLLRHGIWPVYPYHSPELAAFVGKLPWELRHDRNLLRKTLGGLIQADMFKSGYVKEDFTKVAHQGLLENREYLSNLAARSAILRPLMIKRDKVLALIKTNLGMIEPTEFNFLFALLSVVCFFGAP